MVRGCRRTLGGETEGSLPPASAAAPPTHVRPTETTMGDARSRLLGQMLLNACETGDAAGVSRLFLRWSAQPERG
jgi:hypothetical protein